MFTGIVRHMGHFKGYRLGKREIAIDASTLASRLEPGESLAVNGACLSLIKKEKTTLFFNLSKETLERTNLAFLRPGELLNLELPLTLSSFLNGHLVSGHVDCVEKVLRITEKRNGKRFVISLSPDLRPYFVIKGSVALNGVSLTISDLSPLSFDAEIIPITLKNSNLGALKRGDKVNIESDIIGKYVYNFMRKESRLNKLKG